jgi:hypothetical protein
LEAIRNQQVLGSIPSAGSSLSRSQRVGSPGGREAEADSLLAEFPEPLVTSTLYPVYITGKRYDDSWVVVDGLTLIHKGLARA